MWNKILHQEEDLHQYVLQKLLHEAGPEHQSGGPINAVSSPKHWDWQSWKKAGYADGVYQAHLQAELDEIEEEEDESGPVYEGTAVITEVASLDE